MRKGLRKIQQIKLPGIFPKSGTTAKQDFRAILYSFMAALIIFNVAFFYIDAVEAKEWGDYAWEGYQTTGAYFDRVLMCTACGGWGKYAVMNRWLQKDGLPNVCHEFAVVDKYGDGDTDWGETIYIISREENECIGSVMQRWDFKCKKCTGAAIDTKSGIMTPAKQTPSLASVHNI